MLARGWRWALAISVLALLVIGHPLVPHAFALGTLWETGLPWVGAVVPLAAVAAVVRRSPAAGAATLVLLIAWLVVCGPMLLRHRAPGQGDVRVVTHNVLWTNQDPAGTARVLAGADPDLVAIQDVRPDTIPVYAAALDARLPHRVALDHDAIWSRWPIHDASTLDLGARWTGVHRAVLEAPGGPLVLYAVHLPRPSPRTFAQVRDDMLTRLAAAVRAERASRLVVAGDLNAGELDSALRPLTEQLHDAVTEAASGPAFTWPAWLPVVGLDRVLSRGLEPAEARVLAMTGSDHRPLLAELSGHDPRSWHPRR